MVDKYCISCGLAIPSKRVELLPHTRHCVNCSSTGRIAGHPIISGKNTYSELQLMAPERAQALYESGRRTGSIVSSGVRGRAKPLGK